MRDPFANYDRWLERPYEEEADRQAELEWINEHSTFELECCGEDITDLDETRDVYESQQEILTVNPDIQTWTPEQRKYLMFCGACQDWVLINKIEPEIPEDEGPEYEPDVEFDDGPTSLL